MSLENLKEYARRCATEPELRAKAKAIGIEDMEQHMRHAEILGLDWTMDDMATFRKEVLDDPDNLQNLTEEELEQVAGGICTTTAVVLAGLAVGGTAAALVGGAAGAALGGGAASAAGAWGGW